MNNRFSFPENDKTKRYLLGELGNNNILCVGLNPSTADKDVTDPTSISIEKIAYNHSYDGWVLVNLYPKRTSKPKMLEILADKDAIKRNYQHIEEAIKKYNIQNVWLAWGNNVVERKYFNDCIVNLSQVLQKFDLNILSIGTNDTKHPTHPSPQAINMKFKNGKKVELIKFDFEEYLAITKLKIR